MLNNININSNLINYIRINSIYITDSSVLKWSA